MEQQAAVALLQRLDTLTQGLQRHYAKEGTTSAEEPRLVSELSQLRLSELRQQCESAGVSEAHIDDAMESDSPKQAVAELLVRADSRSVSNRTPAQTAFAAAKRYEQGGPGHTEPFEAAREMLLQATAQHGAEQCVYYLLHNTEPKFGIARALMCLFRSMNLLILPVILHQYSDKETDWSEQVLCRAIVGDGEGGIETAMRSSHAADPRTHAARPAHSQERVPCRRKCGRTPPPCRCLPQLLKDEAR